VTQSVKEALLSRSVRESAPKKPGLFAVTAAGSLAFSSCENSAIHNLLFNY